MLFLEGEPSLRDRKAPGNLESSLLNSPPASMGRTPWLPGNVRGPISQSLLPGPRGTVPSLLDFPLAPSPCLFPAWPLAEVSRGGSETPAHLLIFMASGGGVGMTTCSLRKIITGVVFELTAERRVRCQECVHFGCGRTCAPED